MKKWSLSLVPVAATTRCTLCNVIIPAGTPEISHAICLPCSASRRLSAGVIRAVENGCATNVDQRARLAAVIMDGIARRGFYLLMDDRLDLIAGGNGSGNDAAAQNISISAFAAQNLFSWRFLDGLALFLPLPI
jgi:hypothetical protein